MQRSVLLLKEHWLTGMVTYEKQLRLQAHFCLLAENKMAEGTKGLFIKDNRLFV
jgi:hypothetical protein